MNNRISQNETDEQIDNQIYTLEMLLEKRRINEFSKKLNKALSDKLKKEVSK